MKANPRDRAPLLILAPIALLAGCVPPPATAPRPTQGAAPAPRPSAPSPRSPAPGPLPTAANWRDAPATAGSWTYTAGPGGSAASFGTLFAIRCDPRSRTVALVRFGTSHAAAAAIAITTSAGARSLTATPVPRGLAATLAARDPLLDAMAFSNGRFMVQVPGEATLHAPSWTEVSRVVEDCR